MLMMYTTSLLCTLGVAIKRRQHASKRLLVPIGAFTTVDTFRHSTSIASNFRVGYMRFLGNVVSDIR